MSAILIVEDEDDLAFGLASLFRKKGHDVVCIDLDASKVDRINRGESPIFEKGLDELLRRNVGKNLRAALPADSDYPDHCRVVRARSLLYSAKFSHTLRGTNFTNSHQLMRQLTQVL